MSGTRRAPPPGLTASRMEVDGRTVLVLSFPVPGGDSSSAAGHRLAGLSAAEREVADLLLQGETRAAIARARGTALGTVHKQIESVFRKLGVRSRRELAARVFGDRSR